MNRILVAIDRMNEIIRAKNLPANQLEKLSNSLNMDLEEYCKFQERKSLAMLEGKLSPDEAQTVYGFLGNTPEQFNSQPVAVKVVLTKVFAELLSAAIKR